MKFQSLKRQRGISLLEVMLSLSIIAIVLTMAVRYFAIVSRDSQYNQAVQIIGEIQQGVVKCATNLGDGCTATTVGLPELYTTYGYISKPTSALKTDPWGGTLSYAPATTTLTMTAVPTFYCTRIQNQYPGATCSGGSFSLNVLAPVGS